MVRSQYDQCSDNAGTNALSDIFSGSLTIPGLWECVVEASDGTDVTPTTKDIEVECRLVRSTHIHQLPKLVLQVHLNLSVIEYLGTTLDGLVTF